VRRRNGWTLQPGAANLQLGPLLVPERILLMLAEGGAERLEHSHDGSRLRVVGKRQRKAAPSVAMEPDRAHT
jgi:hypothetical protein